MFLKVFCTFKAIDAAADATPIIIWNTYKLTNESETPAEINNNTTFPFTRAQLVDTRIGFENLLVPSSDKLTYFKDQIITSGTYANWGIEAVSNVTVNTNGNVTLNAYNNFSLKPGFSLKVNGTNKFSAGFAANSGIIATNTSTLTSIKAEYFGDCDITLKSTQEGGAFNEEDAGKFNFINKIYPNPINNELNLYMNLRTAEKAKVQVLNVMGQIVHSNEYYDNEVTINTSSYNSGMYIINILRGDQIFTQKFIKE